MKRFVFVMLAALLVCGIGPLSPAAAQDLKVGVVDLFKVLNESEAGKRAKGNLESLIKSKQAAIDEKGKSIEKMKADLDKQAAVLSAEARKQKEEELERLVRDYQRIAADSQAEVKKKESELTGGILAELRQLIVEIGSQEKYTLILENAGGVVLYFQPSVDLTNKVIAKFNQSKAGATKK